MDSDGRRLDKLTQPVKDAFEEMNNDTRYLDQLDSLDRFDRLIAWKQKLAYLFGQFGTELENRIPPFVPESAKTDIEVIIVSLEGPSLTDCGTVC